MSEPGPQYTATTNGAVKWVEETCKVIDTETLEKLRPNLIAALRYVDLVLYGDSSKTIPERRR